MSRRDDIRNIIAEHSPSFEEYCALVELHEELAWQTSEYMRRTDIIPPSSFTDTEPCPTVSTIPAPVTPTLPSPRAA
jgi:hypothetical protein